MRGAFPCKIVHHQEHTLDGGGRGRGSRGKRCGKKKSPAGRNALGPITAKPAVLPGCVTGSRAGRPTAQPAPSCRSDAAVPQTALSGLFERGQWRGRDTAQSMAAAGCPWPSRILPCHSTPNRPGGPLTPAPFSILQRHRGTVFGGPIDLQMPPLPAAPGPRANESGTGAVAPFPARGHSAPRPPADQARGPHGLPGASVPARPPRTPAASARRLHC